MPKNKLFGKYFKFFELKDIFDLIFIVEYFEKDNQTASKIMTRLNNLTVNNV
jgi:hypothetical protein